MIPAEAVEAAARAMLSCQEFGGMMGGWEGLDEEERETLRRDARRVLEAAAPHMMASPVITERMVDAVLDYSGTPRRKLFEYPYRDDDSRDIIKRAEVLVQRILMLDNEGEK